jgi:carboxylate-amine ligase
VLPILLAISANSPFLDGRVSGLHSSRSQIFTKSFPRCGVPDVYGDWETYVRYIDFLMRTRSIVEYTQVWWSIRPHFSFGTVEVRICEAQTSGGESEALAALIVACVAQAARDHDERVPFEDPERRFVEENFWRAIRYGVEGELIDLVRGELYPGAEAVDRLLAWTAPMRDELGLDVDLPALNGAQRQLRMLDSGMTMRDVFAATVAETRETYAPSTVEVTRCGR